MPVNVMVFTAIPEETKQWVGGESNAIPVEIEGAFAAVLCDRRGLCVAALGKGKANAAASATAIFASRRFELADTLFITVGTAGAAPSVASIGSVVVANWIVDWDLAHHLLPPGPLPPNKLFLPLTHNSGSQVFELNAKLAQLAYDVIKDTRLARNEALGELESLYPNAQPPPPTFLLCATLTGDDFWVGSELSAVAADMVQRETGGRARYCTSEMEDSATALALKRFGYLDRYIDIRAVSDFDQPAPGQSMQDLMKYQLAGVLLASENAGRAGKVLVDFALHNHDKVWSAIGK